jgi:hypothetical protein
MANVDVGHTHPIPTFPVGSTARMRVGASGCSLVTGLATGGAGADDPGRGLEEHVVTDPAVG